MRPAIRFKSRDDDVLKRISRDQPPEQRTSSDDPRIDELFVNEHTERVLREKDAKGTRSITEVLRLNGVSRWLVERFTRRLVADCEASQRWIAEEVSGKTKPCAGDVDRPTCCNRARILMVRLLSCY